MRLASMLAAIAVAALASTAVHAQVTPPGEDHYLVYKVLNPPTFSVPVTLTDQFIHADYLTYTLDYFMIPVDKNGEGIIDPQTHYTWWKITPYTFGATCIITNQFGNLQPVQVGSPQYLLNPAWKGLPATGPHPGPPPVKNHYVAYDAASPFPVGLPVSLVDQFGPLQAIVQQMRYLAPPAEKVFEGKIDPILDPVNHLAFYLISPLPPVPPPPPVFATDEFGVWQLVLGDRVMLGVPSFKSNVVGTKKDTWGGVKTHAR